MIQYLPSRLLRALAVCLLAVTVAAGIAQPHAGIAQHRLTPPLALAQGSNLTPYAMIDQWPDRDAASAGSIKDAVGLAVATDGRVYISDHGLGGVHVMLPDGQFLPPFGGSGSGPERLGGAGDISIPPDEDRLYVLDTGTQRVVAFDLDGVYQTAWGGIDGASVAAGPGGVVYVADRQKNRIVAYDRAGAERFTFGTTGTGEGEFTGITDMSVSDDGTVLAVGDYNAVRLQLFDVAANGLRFRRAYDLAHPKYVLGFGRGLPCLASQVGALGGDEVLVAAGLLGSCHLTGPGPDEFTKQIGVADGGTICPSGIVLFSVRPTLGQYAALTTYDPNLGSCARGTKQHVLPTTPAVVLYHDIDRRQVATIHLAAANSHEDSGLQAPRHLSVTPAGKVLVMDRSNRIRVYGADGTAEDTVPMVDTYAGAGETTRRLYLDVAADLRGESGEVIAYYQRERQVAIKTLAEFEHGAGRFRHIRTPWRGLEVDVAEPVWTTLFSPPPYSTTFGDLSCGVQGLLSRSQCAQAIDLAYSATADAAYVLIVRGATGDEFRSNLASGVDEDARIAVVAADGSGLRQTWDLPDTVSGTSTFNPWVDLDVGPDGMLWALDSIADEAVSFDAKGTVLTRVPVRVDVKRIAAGKDGTLFGLRDAGYVERYDRNGTVTARFDARPFSQSDPTTLAAFDVDGEGRVFVADELSGLVSVFAPAAESAIPAPADNTCHLVPSKTAAPTSLRLGDPVDVDLGIAGRCGPGAESTDVVIASVQLYRNRASIYTNEERIKLIRQLIGRIDLTNNRIGLVSYLATAFVEQEMTSDRKVLGRSVGTLRVGPDCLTGDLVKPDCPVPQVQRALQTAMTMLRDSAAARRVVVLPLPDYCSPDLAWRRSACTGYLPAEDIAREAMAAGIRIVVVSGRYRRDAFVLASSDADSVSNADEAAPRIISYHSPEHLATNFELVDELPANMPLVSGSVSAPGTIAGRAITWQLPAIDGGETFRLRVRPAETGRHPTNVQAIARFVDGWGKAQEIVFPVPVVEVSEVVPTATFTPPSPTATPEPTPPTVTIAPPPTATPPAAPAAVYLPMAMNGKCLDRGGVDVALVVDTSNSMVGEKLSAAREALRRFIALLSLRPDGDRAAVVAFSAQAALVAGLTADRPALDAAVGSLATSEGTRLDLGLAMAREALGAGRPTSNRPVVIVLSDGRADDPVAALSEASTLRAAGVSVWAIGLGEDADGPLLAEVAGNPTRYLSAPSAADLSGAYVRISGSIPCK